MHALKASAGRCAPALASPAAAQPGQAGRIGRAAIAALYDELALYPKPGLVSLVDSGSHHDMAAGTFMRSLFALRHYFVAIAALGAQDAPFADLERLGRDAEQRMLQATAGINTHRGAVFSLGLLCAAAGRLGASAIAGRPISAPALRQTLLQAWGPALDQRRRRPELPSNGQAAARRHGLRSAGDEAALGFPVLFEVTLPALRAALAAGLDARSARLQALFHTLVALDDTNLVHRGGLASLHFARLAAADFLAAGGAGRPDGLAHAQAIHREFVARNLSPGGAADLLAAACCVQRICAPG